MEKILCLDFDGVIHSYSSGWKGPRVIPDDPVHGALKFLYEAITCGEFQVMIYSSRSRYLFARRAMKKWLFSEYMKLAAVDPEDRWHIPDVKTGEIPEWLWKWIAGFAFADPWDDEARDAIKKLLRQLKWPTRKPPAFLTIDDRAWTFRGTWPDLLSIQLFKPWNKQEI